jgi:hypothetical protein
LFEQVGGAAADLVGVCGCGLLKAVEEVFEAYLMMGVDFVKADGFSDLDSHAR